MRGKKYRSIVRIDQMNNRVKFRQKIHVFSIVYTVFEISESHLFGEV